MCHDKDDDDLVVGQQRRTLDMFLHCLEPSAPVVAKITDQVTTLSKNCGAWSLHGFLLGSHRGYLSLLHC